MYFSQNNAQKVHVYFYSNISRKSLLLYIKMVVLFAGILYIRAILCI